MAGGSSDDEGGLIADINVTPLVDITLVLLIIFMVAAPLIMNQAIKVKLPKASTGKPADTTTIAIVIKTDGKIYLNGKPTTRAALKAHACNEAAKVKEASKQKKKKKLRAIVSAEGTVKHEIVVSFLDLLRRCEVTQYAVSIERAPPPKEKGPAP